MIEQYTEEILNAVKLAIADETHELNKVRAVVKEYLQKSYDFGYNEAEIQRAIDEAGADY
jgi:ribose 5-phosphate isomerase RpiB